MSNWGQKFAKKSNVEFPIPLKAYSWFLARDFPDVNFEDGKQDEVLFTPYQYLYHRGDLPHSESSEFQSLKDDIKQAVEIQIKAQEFEAKVFEAFKAFFLGSAGVNFKSRLFSSLTRLLINSCF